MATVTTGEMENPEDGEAAVVAAEEGGTDNGTDVSAKICELQATSKPAGKLLGKAAKEKKELHSHFLRYLEQEDDQADLQFNSMAARVKQKMPVAE